MVKETLITVFGGAGLVGRYTVRVLAKAGYRLRVGVRKPNLAGYLVPMGHVGQIQLVKADVRDADAVNAAMAGAQGVVNLAGTLYARGQSFEDVHTNAAGKMAELVRAAGIGAFVHVSAIGADVNSQSAYSRSKGKGERVVREAYPDVAILRPSAIFGPEDEFFNQFASMARFSPALPLPGGGHTKLQPVFAGDVAEAIQKCLEDPTTRGQVYELGGPRVYTFREMMELIYARPGASGCFCPCPIPC